MTAQNKLKFRKYTASQKAEIISTLSTTLRNLTEEEKEKEIEKRNALVKKYDLPLNTLQTNRLNWIKKSDKKVKNYPDEMIQKAYSTDDQRKRADIITEIMNKNKNLTKLDIYTRYLRMNPVNKRTDIKKTNIKKTEAKVIKVKPDTSMRIVSVPDETPITIGGLSFTFPNNTLEINGVTIKW